MADEMAKIREGFEVALDALDGVRVYKYTPPGMPNEIPFISLDSIDVDYGQVVGGGVIGGVLTATLGVKTSDPEEDQALLEQFMDSAGSNSIYELIDADRTLGDNVANAWLIGFADAGDRDFGENIPVRATTITFGFIT